MRLQGTPLIVALLFTSFLGGVCGGALVAASVVTVRAQGGQAVTTTQLKRARPGWSVASCPGRSRRATDGLTLVLRLGWTGA